MSLSPNTNKRKARCLIVLDNVDDIIDSTDDNHNQDNHQSPNNSYNNNSSSSYYRHQQQQPRTTTTTDNTGSMGTAGIIIGCSSSSPCCCSWDDLPREAVLLIGCYADAVDLGRLARTNKANLSIFRHEIDARSILGIRLAYLNDGRRRGRRNSNNDDDGNNNNENENDNNNKPFPASRDRFHRLIEIGDHHRADDESRRNRICTEEFFQEEMLPPQRIILRHMFDYNQRQLQKQSSTTRTGCQFVLAGGSILCYYREYFLKSTSDGDGKCKPPRENAPPTFGDLDVFVMGSPDGNFEETDKAVEEVLTRAGAEIAIAAAAAAKAEASEEDESNYEYAVVRNSGTLTVVVRNSRRPLQIILRRIGCIEELLCFFDLDCCRFAYDGRRLLSTVEGLRAVQLKRNFVDMEHVNNPMYFRRAIKYGRRGFDTGFGRIHPLQHLLPISQNVFHRGRFEFSHSHCVEASCKHDVDEGLYTALGNATLEELHEMAAYVALENDDDDSDELDRDYGNMQDRYGELRLGYRHSKRRQKEMLDEGGFAVSFQIHFEILPAESVPMFRHHYYESHLRRKYNIARCYITGKWFHCKAAFDTSDDDGDEDGDGDDATDDNEDDVHFSPEGRRINDLGKSASRDLTGAVALVTGARVKIGYATCLELLRRGATVIGTTRFVADAAARYRSEGDYEAFRDRLHLVPLNLLSVEDIQKVVAFVRAKIGTSGGRIRILVNNAAQTVRLPLRCYTKLIQNEYRALYKSLGGKAAAIEDEEEEEEYRAAAALALSKQKLNIQLPSDSLAHLYAPPIFLATYLQDAGLSVDDADLPEEERLRVSCLRCMFKNPHPDDLIDFRDGKIPKDPMKASLRKKMKKNSWKLEPTDIHPIELFETQTINHLAPTMLLNSLVPLLQASPPSSSTAGDKQSQQDSGPSYVINVTSVEGQFAVNGGVKESKHLHTNMSKAALNMLTRSGASFYAKRGILVNSVDTGWVSSTIPSWKDPPLKERDAALRILYPILTRSMACGKLYKNYQEVPW